MKYEFLGKVMITGIIQCETGLHIGGTSTGIEIGGLDNLVIKDPASEHPYIPGSSMRGKLRSLLEWMLGLIGENKEQNGYFAYACQELENIAPQDQTSGGWKRWHDALTLGKLFGPATTSDVVRERCGPTRLIIRDSMPCQDTIKDWISWFEEGIFTEIKTENVLDRVTAVANPRPMERVARNSKFDFDWLVDLYCKEDWNLLKPLFQAMHLLENSSLGGSGSRGYGQISFQDMRLSFRSLDYYRNEVSETEIDPSGKTPRELSHRFSEIQNPVAG